MLESVCDCYKNQQMCDKAVDNYPHELKFGPGCYTTQKMCDKAVKTHPSTIPFSVNPIRLKKCVTKLFLKILY